MCNYEFDDTMHDDTATTIVSEQAQLGNIGTPLSGVALHYEGESVYRRRGWRQQARPNLECSARCNVKALCI